MPVHPPRSHGIEKWFTGALKRIVLEIERDDLKKSIDADCRRVLLAFVEAVSRPGELLERLARLLEPAADGLLSSNDSATEDSSGPSLSATKSGNLVKIH